jgi:peroxiredoxin
MIDQIRPLAIGDRLPDLPLHDLAGRALRIGEFRGRPLLLFMWASW